MAKRTLSDEHVKKMLKGRQVTRELKKAALEAVENPVLQKAAFWKGVDDQTADGIAKAIGEAAAARKAARIKDLEKELARLKDGV